MNWTAETAAQPRRGTVLVVDDHHLITLAFSTALTAEDLNVIVATEPDVERLLAIACLHRPVLALVDLQFGGSASEGIHIVKCLAARTRVLVLTGVTDPAVLGGCLEDGAIGVLSKAEPFDCLLGRIGAALRGEPVHSLREQDDLLVAARARRTDTAQRLAPFRSLSAREAEVLSHLASGLTADAIAGRTYVSVATVRTHIQAILRKLEVRTQLAAVARAHQSGWELEPSS